ncbi:hypothetical protein [Kitasatospora sp. McL0602]|uniref:hypothetical protein n=1 Tax=Kitasatospora sp. McL0602 TaxID=3439530 RepID=UPI003F8B6A8C
MSSRRVLCAAAGLAAAALALTGCGPKASGTTGQAASQAAPQTATAPATAPAASDPAAGSTATPGADAATGTPAAGTPGTGASNPAVSSTAPIKPGAPTCKPDKPVAAGHKVVVASKHATLTKLIAQDGVFDCTSPAPDYGYWPKGPEKTYTIAANAKAELAGPEHNQTVTLAKLIDHIGKCLDGDSDTPSCASGKTYDIALDASGRVTGLTELYSP